MRRGYLTDFHGSAGTALVTASSSSEEEEGEDKGKAYLWTDSRYFNEASLRLDPDHWVLMKQGNTGVPSIIKFLTDMAVERHGRQLGGTSGITTPLRVGMDAYVHSASFAKELIDSFETAAADVVVDARADDSSDTAAVVNGHDDGALVRPSAPVVIAVLDTLDGRPNIVDSIWEGRPALPKTPFRVHVSV